MSKVPTSKNGPFCVYNAQGEVNCKPNKTHNLDSYGMKVEQFESPLNHARSYNIEPFTSHAAYAHFEEHFEEENTVSQVMNRVERIKKQIIAIRDKNNGSITKAQE
jgi:hypothetical protein